MEGDRWLLFLGKHSGHARSWLSFHWIGFWLPAFGGPDHRDLGILEPRRRVATETLRRATSNIRSVETRANFIISCESEGSRRKAKREERNLHSHYRWLKNRQWTPPSPFFYMAFWAEARIFYRKDRYHLFSLKAEGKQDGHDALCNWDKRESACILFPPTRKKNRNWVL